METKLIQMSVYKLAPSDHVITFFVNLKTDESEGCLSKIYDYVIHLTPNYHKPNERAQVRPQSVYFFFY